MDTKELMAGIAVVIDDQLDSEKDDLIDRIVGWFEREWKLPFVKLGELPTEQQWPNLLQAASFVLLDWRLWGEGGGDALRASTIRDIVQFLKAARESLVPVFIFTNESADDVISELPQDVYEEPGSGRSFVFVKRKLDIWSEESVDVETLDGWVHGNASVYALRMWGRALASAKSELFQKMRDRSVDWPRVFWKSYLDDGADPSSSLTNLINDSLVGRMPLDLFEGKHLGGGHGEVSGDELRGLIAEASFRDGGFLPPDEIKCGDLYETDDRKKYLLNLRPDCDCIPRNGSSVDDVNVYCVEGEKLKPGEVHKLFKKGHFEERVFQSFVFAVVDGESILFSFKELAVLKYSDVKGRRAGRLLHPFVTRVQQRYALYVQRQALPRIPDGAVP